MNRRVNGCAGLVLAGCLLAACGGMATPDRTALDAYAKGKAAYLKQDLAAADGHFRAALDACPSFPNALVMLGKVRFFDGKHDAAATCFANALALSANHGEALYYLARIRMLKGNRTQAIASLESILETDPGNARANYALGELYAANSDYKNAFLHFNNALEEEPMLARIRLAYATVLAKAGLKDRARKMLEPALDYPASEQIKTDIHTLAKDLK